MSLNIHFLSDFSIFEWTGTRDIATISPIISRHSHTIRGILISKVVRVGSRIINITDRSETSHEIRDDICRNSFPRFNFSRVHLRNDEDVPIANALAQRDIQILASVNKKNPFDTRYRIEELARRSFANMSVFFCHQWSAIYPEGIWNSILAIYHIPVYIPISLACVLGSKR